MADVNEYLAHFSQELCQEIKDYATNVALISSRYIFVDTKGKQQYGYCTHCNKEFKTHIPKPSERELAELEMCGCSAAMVTREDWEKKRQGNKMKCPACGSQCTVKHVNRGYKNLRDFAYFTFYEKSILDPKMLVARFMCVARDYRKSYKNVETEYVMEAYYVFEYKKGGKQVKDVFSWKTGYHKGFAKKVHSMESYHSYSRVTYSEESIANAVKDTPFAWSGWERYSGYFGDMVIFFDLFARYPMTEYLTKLGYRSLIIEKLQGKLTFNAINWRGKDIFKVFKLTKDEFNTIKQQNIKVTYWFLHLIKLNKEKNWGLSLKELEDFSVSFTYEGEIESIKELCILDMTFRDAFKYISKQFHKLGRSHYYSGYSVIRDWKDYIKDCKELGKDMTLECVCFPKNLREAHDETNQIIQRIADEKLNAKFIERSEKLKEYCFEYNGLFIRPAMSPAELVAEGKALTHCVGGYSKDHAEGRTSIFFIRKTDKPNKSFYTVEIKKKWNSNELEIHQCRSYKNHTPKENNHQDVIEFIEVFKAEKLTKKKRVKITA